VGGRPRYVYESLADLAEKALGVGVERRKASFGAKMGAEKKGVEITECVVAGKLRGPCTEKNRDPVVIEREHL
jgi:hypothetical protein